MLSTPPAIISSASPALIARAAMPTASMPEPHSRLTVVPGHLDRQAGEQRAMRATLRLSSPAWLAQPKITSSTAAQSTRRVARHQRPQRDRARDRRRARAASAPP